MVTAIQSFPNGSSDDPNGLRPQHLKDMIGPGAGEGCVALIKALASFVSSSMPFFLRCFVDCIVKKIVESTYCSCLLP